MQKIERLANFSDAVVAIAVTLLVLPLTERAASIRIVSFRDFKEAFTHLIFIFLLSFVVVCRYWLVQHGLINSLKTFNNRVFWLNAAWLMSIALIPFTSEIIGNSNANSALITGIYIGSLLLTSYIGFAMKWVILRSPELQKASLGSLRHCYSGLAVTAMTLALVVSIIFPTIGPLALLIMIPLGFSDKRMQRKTS